MELKQFSEFAASITNEEKDYIIGVSICEDEKLAVNLLICQISMQKIR